MGRYIVDDFGYHWYWNGKRVFCLEAEIEFIDKGFVVEKNGYRAETEDYAIQTLINGGYIAKDPRM